MAAWESNVFVCFAQMAPFGPLEFSQNRQKHYSPPVRAFGV